MRATTLPKFTTNIGFTFKIDPNTHISHATLMNFHHCDTFILLDKEYCCRLPQQHPPPFVRPLLTCPAGGSLAAERRLQLSGGCGSMAAVAAVAVVAVRQQLGGVGGGSLAAMWHQLSSGAAAAWVAAVAPWHWWQRRWWW